MHFSLPEAGETRKQLREFDRHPLCLGTHQAGRSNSLLKYLMVRALVSAALMLVRRRGGCFVATVPPGFTGQRMCESFQGTRLCPHVGIRGSLPSSPGGLLGVSKRALQKESEAQESGLPEESEAR